MMNFHGSSSFSFSANFRWNFKTCFDEKPFFEAGFHFTVTWKKQPILRRFSAFVLNFPKLEQHILVWKALYIFCVTQNITIGSHFIPDFILHRLKAPITNLGN